MRIVLFGATGYTGNLTLRALVRHGAHPVLAGRDRRRLADLAADTGGVCEVAVADATDEASVRALVRPDDVVVTTVGPFAQLGMPAARAAAEAGAVYLDSTGEPAFLRRVVDEVSRTALGTGATLVPAFGYDYVPGNLAAERVLAEAPDATHVRVGYFVAGRGAASGGTLASGAGMMLDPAYAWQGGGMVPDRMGSTVARFDLDGRRRDAVSLAGSEHLWVPRRHGQVTDVGVYLGWAGRYSRFAPAASAGLRAVTAVPGGRGLAQAAARRALPGSTGGPDAASRAGARTRVVAEAARPGRGRLARTVLDGPNPYDLTAELLAWAAVRATTHPPQATGVVGPVDLFGYEALEQGAADLGLCPVA